MAGTLYLVGTPIGNLEDITLRALRVLKEVHVIAAEDTRQTRKLTSHFGIGTPLVAYHEHNERKQAAVLARRLLGGESVALVSDAGMPGISDPGLHLVRACRDAGVPVVAVPGPTAAVTALVISGLPTARFAFEGFLPRSGRERREALQRLAVEQRTAILYESPHRLLQTLADLAAAVGDRQVAVCRELTKVFEEVRTGTAAELRQHFELQGPRGEVTLVVEGAPDLPLAQGDPVQAVEQLQAEGVDRMEALKQAARQFGLSKRQVYALAEKKKRPQSTGR